MRVFRVILPVEDLEAAAVFYGRVLGSSGERVTAGRHYFDCDGVILACLDVTADGHTAFPGPNRGHVYFSAAEPLEDVRDRALAAGARPDKSRAEIERQPWGERSFYVHDPWGNPICFVEAGTEYRGGRSRAAP